MGERVSLLFFLSNILILLKIQNQHNAKATNWHCPCSKASLKAHTEQEGKMNFTAIKNTFFDFGYCISINELCGNHRLVSEIEKTELLLNSTDSYAKPVRALRSRFSKLFSQISEQEFSTNSELRRHISKIESLISTPANVAV